MEFDLNKELARFIDEQVEGFVWQELGISPYVDENKMVKPVVVDFLKDYTIVIKPNEIGSITVGIEKTNGNSREEWAKIETFNVW